MKKKDIKRTIEAWFTFCSEYGIEVYLNDFLLDKENMELYISGDSVVLVVTGELGQEIRTHKNDVSSEGDLFKYLTDNGLQFVVIDPMPILRITLGL